jgi:hypothetical protein
MGKKREKFKAAFLPKGKLAARAGEREQSELQRLKDALALAEELGPGEGEAATKRLGELHQRVLALSILSARDPGAAWIGLGEIAPEIEREILLLQELAGQKDGGPKDARRANQLLAATRQALAAAQNGCRSLAAAGKRKAASKLSLRADDLANRVGQAAGVDPPLLDTLRAHRDEALLLLREVREAGGRPKAPETQAAASKAVLGDLAQIPAFGKRLDSDAKDPQGRTAREDLEQRLAVFDQYYAADVGDDDPDAAVRNQAMRLAATTSVVASRVGAELNDPYLVPRVGQSMVAEYAPEMRASLSRGADSDDDADHAIRLAQALVMDDPVGKLMLGKMNPTTAVQCIRDMAAVGGVDPSQMLKMLRQQFEMKMTSLTVGQVKAGAKQQDNVSGKFVLEDITGELSPTQFNAMFAVDERDSGASAVRTDDGSALEFKAAAGQVHTTVGGDTFGTLALAYLGDAAKWATIRDLNQVLVQRPDAQNGKAAVVQQTNLKGLGQDDALPAGLKLTVPGKLSLLDQLAPYVAAWDEDLEEAENDEEAVDVAGSRKPKTPTRQIVDDEDDGNDSPSSRPLITPDELRAAAGKLTSPRDLDPNSIQVPGLGQDHQVRAPLGESGKTDAEALHGQINQRQYAHLRLLARADEEDRDAVLAKTGKSVEEHVLTHLKVRYGIDDNKAQRIANGVQAWIDKVPLTMTFTGDRVFSDTTKNAPTHGEKFKSEVELSRGREDQEDLIGRSEQTGGTVGTQGGSKVVTGWKKDRGDNYMRWRRDKDSKEARKDELAFDDQQLYGAANPTFDKTKGTADGDVAGKNYYGDAHFLLKDSVRNRCAFVVRTSSEQVNVQRQDVSMLVFDILTKGSKNDKYGVDVKFMDQMLQMATGAATVSAVSLTWEVHLYGGFDSSKDAEAIYLSSSVAPEAAERIRKFAQQHGIRCEDIGALPTGLTIKNHVVPTTIDLSGL